MKLYIFIVLVLIGYFSITVFGQAKLEGKVLDNRNKPVSGIRVTAPGGQATTTDINGHFIINFPAPIGPGEATRIQVSKPNWTVYQPMFGNCVTQDIGRYFDHLPVIIVPKGSAAALSPAGISQAVAQWAKERSQLKSQIATLNHELDKYAFLRKYARQYGFTLSKVKAEIQKWAYIKDSDNKEEWARKEYWNGNYKKSALLADESAEEAVAELEQLSKQQVEVSHKIIRRNILKGNALYADSRFRDTLIAYNKLEQYFETGKLSKEQWKAEWIELKLLIGNTKNAIGVALAGINILREAVTDLQQVVSLYSKERSPLMWAIAQGYLGLALINSGSNLGGIEGIEYLNKAITILRSALEVKTLKEFPNEWANIQDNLGIALIQLGMLTEGEEGIKYLDEAIATFRATLDFLTHKKFPNKWTITQNRLGVALIGLAERNEGKGGIKYLDEAISDFRTSLKVFNLTKFPHYLAWTQHNLGDAIRSLGERVTGVDGVKYLKEAARIYRLALEIRNREQSPQIWARTQNNLGGTLLILGPRAQRKERIGYLKEAIAIFRTILEVRTRDQFPRDWAQTQYNLGVGLKSLFSELQGTERIRYLKEAIAIFRTILEVRTRDQFPQDWLKSQLGLSLALTSLGGTTEGEEGIKYLKESIANYRMLLEFLIHKHSSEHWIKTQINLVIALIQLGMRTEGDEGFEYVDEAIAVFRAAPEVLKRAQSFEDWREAQATLGIALWLKSKNIQDIERIRYLNEGIALFRAYVATINSNDFPKKWANGQSVLGLMLSDLGQSIEGEEGIKYLDEAIGTFRKGLQVYTSKQFPQEWSNIQYSLKIALERLASAFAKINNLQKASEAYVKVLEIDPDNREALIELGGIYQNVLFQFDKSFALYQQWLTKYPDDVLAEVTFVETLFTTNRFALCTQSINSLLSKKQVSVSSKIVLLIIEIACLIGNNKADQVESKFDTLIAEMGQQLAELKIDWSFDGIRHFTNQHIRFSSYHIWLGKLFNTVTNNNHDTIVKELRELQREFKSQHFFKEKTTSVSRTNMAYKRALS